jgi:RNA polymerase sigma factor (sigma-70 family)
MDYGGEVNLAAVISVPQWRAIAAMPPPPAEPFATRVFLGPALLAQPDRRLVKLVREGYETAFEEIVRRYRAPLDRFAAAIVGGRSEDVTQDAFSKALLALRGTTTEIELRPWLYRIVRNTALNDLRDGPPPTEELGEAIAGGLSAAAEAERREETAELMRRLRALPDPQRAAIVMRELEGLSHEEIAAALGVSGGAARQAIHRGRTALRNGFGLLIPLPLLRMLFDHGAEAAGAGAGGAVAAAGMASASGGGGVTAGGIGAVGALKVGLAAAVLAGSVGAGVAIQHDRGERAPEAAEAAARPGPGDAGDPGGPVDLPGSAPAAIAEPDRHRGGGESGSGEGKGRGGGSDDHGGRGPGGDSGEADLDDPSHHGGNSDSSGRGGRGRGGRPEADDDSGGGESGESHSGRHGSDGSGDDSASGGHGGSGSSGDSGGSGGGGSGPDGGGEQVSDSPNSGHGGSGSSGGPAPAASPAPLPEPPPDGSGDSSGGDDSGSSGSGSGDGGPGGGEIDS